MTGYIDCAVLGTVIVKPQLKRSAKGTAYARVLLVVGDDAYGKQFAWVTCFGEDAQRVAPLLRRGASRSKWSPATLRDSSTAAMSASGGNLIMTM